MEDSLKKWRKDMAVAKKQSTKTIKQFDLIIVGAGLMGLSLAAIMAKHGFSIGLVERFDPNAMKKSSFDGRTTALSLGSRRVLEASDLWKALEQDCCPIEEIRVADGNSPFYLHFDHKEVGKDAFGWIIENRLMRLHLIKALKGAKNITWLAPDEATGLDMPEEAGLATLHLKDNGAIQAPLIIGADGVKSNLRQWAGIESKGWAYDQSAIVCCVDHALDHENIAVEHFLPQGPFAILPMRDEKGAGTRSSIVWTVHNEGKNHDMAAHYMGLSEADFNAVLQEKFGDQLGAVKLVGQRFTYPLSLNHAKGYTGTRLALIGEAAHRMHPIAGQGLNLGMRDVALLAELLVESRRLGLDYGRASLLQSYEKRRKLDNKAMMIATDQLNKLFSNDIGPIKWARQIGLGLVEKTPFAKKFFMRQAMGLSGIANPKSPKLLRGEKL